MKIVSKEKAGRFWISSPLVAALLAQTAGMGLIEPAFAAETKYGQMLLINEELPFPRLSKETIDKALQGEGNSSTNGSIEPIDVSKTAAPQETAKQALAPLPGTSETALPLPDTTAAAEPSQAVDNSGTNAAAETPLVTESISAPVANQNTAPIQTFSTPNLPQVGIMQTTQFNLPPIAVLQEPFKLSAQAGHGPIIIDNDEVDEIEETIKYEDLPTDEGKTRVKTGARFPVVITSEITSKTAKKGEAIQARLKYDLKIGDRLVAKKGAVVTGHLDYVLPARSTLHSLVSPTRWYRNSGVLGISFDEIINEKSEHLPLVARPARKALIVKNKGEGRVLGVNHDGLVTGPWSQQLRYKAVRIGLNAALAPAGVFSFGAMPVALGVIGAANPSFAFMKPVGLNVRHRRLKGFAWGFLSGIPGSWLIEDTVVRGQEAVIKPGDEFLAEFKDEFTGEAATDAMLLPGASTKVRGQIETPTKKKK